MNERIQELSKEAWRQIDVSKIRGRHVAYTKIFAELIVRECAEKIAHNEKFNWLDAAQAAKDLKEHFGVEE